MTKMEKRALARCWRVPGAPSSDVPAWIVSIQSGSAPSVDVFERIQKQGLVTWSDETRWWYLTAAGRAALAELDPHRLPRAQADALELLAKHRCYTAPNTYSYGDGKGGAISGVVARSLIKRDFAKFVAGWQVPGGSGSTVVEITDVGRAAIDAHRKAIAP